MIVVIDLSSGLYIWIIKLQTTTKYSKMKHENLLTFDTSQFTEKGELIDYVTVFRKDGTLVYRNDRLGNHQIFKELLHDIYLIVVHFKNREVYIQTVDLTTK